MVKITLAVPRDSARLVGDILHLNGFHFTVELVGDAPALLHVDIDEAKQAAFNPRETIKPIASC